ncbi:hypothetical protein QQP08_003506 [Theobroma cacao]|nr:hypothetical protein QQP08_003506 [Theobroma cacao]
MVAINRVEHKGSRFSILDDVSHDPTNEDQNGSHIGERLNDERSIEPTANVIVSQKNLINISNNLTTTLDPLRNSVVSIPANQLKPSNTEDDAKSVKVTLSRPNQFKRYHRFDNNLLNERQLKSPSNTNFELIGKTRASSKITKSNENSYPLLFLWLFVAYTRKFFLPPRPC